VAYSWPSVELQLPIQRAFGRPVATVWWLQALTYIIHSLFGFCRAMSSSSTLTYDEALTKHIGQFGPGQRLSLLWASTHEIANAAALFIWGFLTVNPIASHSWSCTDPADALCMAVWQQDHPETHSFCSLRADQWQWTNQGVCLLEVQYHM
jgi:hypothetical protein